VVSTHSVIKDSIGLSEDELAFAMMGMPLPAFMFSDVTLFAALAIAAVCIAIAQLSLNVIASEVEARSPKQIMNGCHGF
jgi:hypothetical protein